VPKKAANWMMTSNTVPLCLMRAVLSDTLAGVDWFRFGPTVRGLRSTVYGLRSPDWYTDCSVTGPEW
jgi:hypothetical protein